MLPPSSIPITGSHGNALMLSKASNKDGASTAIQPTDPAEHLGAAGQLIHPDGLVQPSTGTRARIQESPDRTAERFNKMCHAVRTILECVGEDPRRPGLLDTPERYAKAMMTFTEGYGLSVWDVLNKAVFDEDHSNLVIEKGIDVYSVCEHHLVPFMGKMHIGYIPNGSIVGISKLARIADMFSRRLQVQERLTTEVANTIMEVLRPQGVAVIMEASHMCMVMRGVQKSSAITYTSCMLGSFKTDDRARNEFLSLVGAGR
ncbi:hypothetical protein OQA88_5909 [Cercophora sp. LCS_1]